MNYAEHRDLINERNLMRMDCGMDPLPKLNISFSGGRTSAVMTKLLWDSHQHSHDILITFANTGCEDEKTLEFVKECQERFEWPLVWLEAVVDMRPRKGVTHKVVTFETAARNGEPFEETIKKYGIYNRVKPSCTARTKTDPMKSFLKSHGWFFGKKLNHQTAIGIRADEIDRVSLTAMRELGVIYPLVDKGWTKRDVGLEINKWGFDLGIKGDHYGNCTWCWKKSLRKHMTLALEDPSVFDFPERMEKLYGKASSHQACSDENGDTWWFRGNKSVQDIKDLAATTDFEPYSDDAYEHGWDEWLDVGGSCGDSCEIGADLND